MKTIPEIMQLIRQLDTHIADDFEGQDLDFKQWSTRALEDNLNKMIHYAVCLTNGGGGCVVFGVADKVKGYDKTILGVPENLDLEMLTKTVYAETVPPITPRFDEVRVCHGTGMLLIMTVGPSEAIHSTADGKSVQRNGKECLPIADHE
ncbi:putative DNA binding domain-containing protein [Jeotgalibacillus sp. ET6]|uniref:RNA-binding domain-containing protein n=1 Tax=Jeotgalibacillus sp. ET6 TaxID=3037260 RepID=UPI002418AD81|nr:RNA-binding domain-containing protein [Jeotgalibacillus sp. ET6]MDG5472567.1 putative DNA binding domain-containing protein [Jeotgalibacillus sp. ET6]